VDEQALLRAFIADPADDTVRLAYADWLDEHDEPERAEFIRVQIELARLPTDDPRRTALGEREAELFEVLRQERLRREVPAEFARYGGLFRTDYLRGLLACVGLECTPEAVAEFRAAAPALFAAAPVEELVLRPVPGIDWYSRQVYQEYVNAEAIGQLATVTELARLKVVRLHSPVDDINAACLALASNPHLQNLPRLHIHNRYPPDSHETPPVEEWFVDELAADTRAELLGRFGDHVTWDA